MRTAEGHDVPDLEAEPGTGPRAARLWLLAVAGLAGTWVVLGCVALFALPLSSPRAVSAAHPAAAVQPTIAGPVSPSAAPATSAAARPLAAAVSAFGPAGTSDGDNPGIVSRIAGAAAAAGAPAADDSGAAWYTSWYASPEFGNLKGGTGLLLDMGRVVTVSSVQLVLGPQPGADAQLRVGDSPSPAGLTEAAAVSGAGGSVRLTAPHPAKGRYVLIWFTRLPPISPGKFQVYVYGLTVNGTPTGAG